MTSWRRRCAAARCAARRYRACDAMSPSRRKTSRPEPAMSKRPIHSAAELIPDRPTLAKVRASAAECRACHLWKLGTQTVFGEGTRQARLMLVGEQPGNEEDLAGHPFVGPAGKLLDRALADAG